MKLSAKKSLGQHFLNSSHVLEQIISAARIEEGECVLEIGPGTGVLTEALLNSVATVLAVEKDPRAVSFLREKFAEEIAKNKLQLFEGDILDQEWFNLSIVESLNVGGGYSLVSNIPYYITGAILERFLEHGPRPEKMVLLVQKEVAERIIARDGKESVLSISVKAFGAPKLIAKVPPGAFTPPPSVDSAILAIENISDSQFVEKNLNPSRFFSIVKAGFAHKRKFAARNLEAVMPVEEIQQKWNEMGLDQKLRAEDITPEQWFKIAG